MTIFEQLKDIIETKENLLENSLEDESEFVPYLTQRWLSMFSPNYANIMNLSTNRMWRSMEDKQMWYKYFLCIIPKTHNRRIKYIKKPSKKRVAPNTEIIDFLAQEMELSKREIKLYIEQGYIDLKQTKKELNL